MDTYFTQINPYMNDELWSPEKFSLPPRSRLHHLQPMGIGTPMVESLSSYVTRLAYSHGVSVSTLIPRIVSPLLQQTFIKDSTSRSLKAFFYRSQALNGYGTIANDFVEVLNQLTLHRKLKFLTLISLANILVTQGLLRPHKAWCPICYQHCQQNQQVIYDHLLWSLNDVKICVKHQHPLMEACPHCHHKLLWLSWKSNLGYCSHCYQWLGDSFDTSFSKTPIDDWDRWVANSLGELLANADYLSSTLTQEQIQSSLTSIVHHVTAGNIAAFAAKLKIPKNTFWGWYSGKTRPSLSALLKICYPFQLSLLQFLKQEFESFLPNIKEKEFEIQYSKNIRKSAQTPNLDHIQRTLSTILLSDSSPTLTDIAQQLQVNRRLLSRHFPELCNQIVAKHRQHKHILHLAAIEQCCLEIKEAISSLCQSGKHPTESHVCELINNPGYFRYKQVRQFYKREVQAILSRL